MNTQNGVYPVYAVPPDASSQLEQMGTKSKFWYKDTDGQRVLFKEGRPGTGENWAEKVCSEICGMLDLPHAQYDFATWRDNEGVITPSIVPDGARLILGNELLARVIKDYDQDKRSHAKQHTVGRVITVTNFPNISTPLGWNKDPEIETAADVIVGYLMLDALVSNQDRHHENWGVILDSSQGLFLAPTFDHASSMGRNETDQRRQERLTTKDAGMSVRAYVGRAKTPLYRTSSSASPLSTIGAFEEAARLRPVAGMYWLSKLGAIDSNMYQNVFDKVPDYLISDTAREFARKMLEENTDRLFNMGS